MYFPQIKIKNANLERSKKLKQDLLDMKELILKNSPSDFNINKLNRIRIRIFKFQKGENCNEYFLKYMNKKYVCLNSSLLERRYYASLQHILHGIAHSFCHLRDDIGEEVFCEVISYSILNEFLKSKGKKFSRRIIKSIMKVSPKHYNSLFRVGRKLEEREEKILLKLNSKAKNRKISKKKEKELFRKLLKSKKQLKEEFIENIPELERRFRRI